MALLTEAKVKKVANLLEHVPEALGRRATEHWLLTHLRWSLKDRTDLAAKTVQIRSVVTPGKETIALGVSSYQSTAAPSLCTKFALNNETPAMPHQYPTAPWEVISYTALYFLKHFILTFILQPNIKDLFLYKACITST